MTYLKNRSPTTSLDKKTSFEAWYEKKPDLGNLHIFECLAYHHKEGARRKLDEKSIKCRFLGYEGTNQYHLWDGNRVLVFSHVLWDEVATIEGEDYDDDDYACIGFDSGTTPQEVSLPIRSMKPTSTKVIEDSNDSDNSLDQSYEISEEKPSYNEGLTEAAIRVRETVNEALSSHQSTSAIEDESDDENPEQEEEESPLLRRPPRRQAAKPTNYELVSNPWNPRIGGNKESLGFQGPRANKVKKGFAVRALKAKVGTDYSTYPEAKASSDWSLWEKAILDEIEAHTKNKTYTLGIPPPNRRV